MTWLAKLRIPEHITVTRHDDGVDELQAGPPVTLVSDRALREYHVLTAALKGWGYRFVEKQHDVRMSLWVRPLSLWLLHKYGHGVFEDWYHSLGWLYRRGVFHVVTPYGLMPRWRDVRFGRERQARP